MNMPTCGFGYARSGTGGCPVGTISCITNMVYQNGGTNCPACRGLSTVVTPSRALQTMVDVLLHHAPDRARPASERIQADEIYRTGVALRVYLTLASHSSLSLISSVAFRYLAQDKHHLNLKFGLATRITSNRAPIALLATSMDGFVRIRLRTRKSTQIMPGILRMAPHLATHTVVIGMAK